MKRDDRVTALLTVSYLCVFLVVIAALSLAAYSLVAANYRDLLGPALDAPEGALGLRRALRAVAESIVVVDLGLILFVGVASHALARAAVSPLLSARAREERFVADVAHELRTPLSAIASMAQAAPKNDAPACAAALDTITQRALESGKLVGDLLILARGRETRMLITEPTDLAALTSSVIKEQELPASDRGIVLRSHLQSVVVQGDEAHLRRLARNLIENALRHARGAIDVTVDAQGRYARLIVEDDGPGVEAEIRSSLFERFVKGSRSPGSGLGLSICRWTAQAHGGDVRLADGSRFVVRLPLLRT